VRIVSGRAFCRIVERRGWSLLRVTGSHHAYGKPGEQARLSIPVHGSVPFKEGLQRYLMKLARIREDEL
jgi:predicted RNA binding protein YcfA (HicA-like mRNA interferase family)